MTCYSPLHVLSFPSWDHPGLKEGEEEEEEEGEAVKETS